MPNPFEAKDPKSKLLSNGRDFVTTLRNDTYDFIRPEQLDLKGRAVYITGASKGIGRETALSFAKAGASFIGVGARSGLDSLKQDIEAAAKKAGRTTPNVLTCKLDVADNATVEAAAKEVEQAFGRLDVLINNAGYLKSFEPIAESNPEQWTRTYTINVFGVYYMTRAFLPLLRKTSNGLKEILNLSSIGAHTMSPGGSGYCTTKLAVSRFSEFTSSEYPDVLSYSVHPGGVATELAKGMGEGMQHVLIDKPELAADTMVWLTSERRDWLKGRYVSCTWDMEELLKKRQKIEDEDLLKVRLAVGLE